MEKVGNLEGPLINRLQNTRTAKKQGDYDIFNRLYYGHKFDKKGRSVNPKTEHRQQLNRDNAFESLKTPFPTTERLEK